VSKQPHGLQLVEAQLPGPDSERSSFSSRLSKALRDAGYAPDSPTQLAREFNIRFAGKPVTVHAARKWLVGEAIPTQEKLKTLAEWLSVPTEWLRFGGERPDGDASNGSTPATPKIAPEIAASLEILQRLDPHHRTIAQQMLRFLLQASMRQVPELATKAH
jgi:hypothetical protein